MKWLDTSIMYKIKADRNIIKKLIEIAGSRQSLAEKAGISYQSILNWQSGRTSPSAMMCMRLEQAVNGEIKRNDILPDFPWEKFEEEK